MSTSHIKHRSFVGDVTALHLFQTCSVGSDSSPQHVAAGPCCSSLATTPFLLKTIASIRACVGSGSQLLVYHLATGKLCLEYTVLPDGIHVHGIHSLQHHDHCLLAVHGDRHVKVTSTCLTMSCMLYVCKHADWRQLDCRFCAYHTDGQGSMSCQ